MTSKEKMKKIEQLEGDNWELRLDIAGWLNWTYYLPKGWRPMPMIKKSRQIMRKCTCNPLKGKGKGERASGNSRSGG